MRSVVMLVLAVLAGGCIDGAAPASCSAAKDFATPLVHGHYMQTAPDAPWQTVVRTTGDANADLAVAAGSWPAWTLQLPNASLAAGAHNASLHVVTVQPGSQGPGGLKLAYAVHGCAHAQTGHIAWDLAAPKRGVTAEPGQGVHVMTAGFLTDGTLFYTNIPEVDTDWRWPRPDWYAWEGDAPLPVYVYDQDRSEQPAYWKAPSASQPRTGDATVDGVVHEVLYDVDVRTGLGYFTTIAGFNEALKGLPTTSMHVAVLAPEQAYTRPGNEAHPLYGESLVFLIKVLDVVTAPCPHDVDAERCDDDVPMRQAGADSPPVARGLAPR